MTAAAALTLLPVEGIGEITAGDDLATILWSALGELRAGDILVVTSKVVSKALGLYAPAGLDRGELVLAESTRVVSERTTTTGFTRIVAARSGPVMAGAGIDASNSDDERLLLLPHDPDAVARDLHAALAALAGHDRFGLILSDTSGRAWRAGVTDFALGSHHVAVLEDLRGLADTHGRDLAVTIRNIADEIASAADLVKGKLHRVPAAVVRGLDSFVGGDGDAATLVRSGPTDWFALGRAESVRDALGVAPGSPLAYEAGVESVHPEDLGARVGRAWSVTVLPEEEPEAVALDGGDRRWRVICSDPYLLGRSVARFEVALAGERLRSQAVSRGEDHVELSLTDR
ncbi:coenzyme F420-0:L-glutamate ligase [Calidifontibacter terrae]